MSYSAPTFTYSLTTSSVAGTYSIEFTATTEGSLLDTENIFNLILLPLNVAPVITIDAIDATVAVTEIRSQTMAVTDADITDDHSLVCSVVPVQAFTIDCSNGLIITYSPTDDSIDPGVYTVSVTLSDDDSEGTGTVNSLATSFVLTVTNAPLVVVGDDESPYWSGTFK